MKKITVLSGLLISTLFLKAQDCDKVATFTVAIETGISINRAMAAGVSLGLNLRQFNIRGGFDAHLTDKVNNGAVFHLQVGKTFDTDRFYITPAIGRAYLYKSADKGGLNYGAMYYNLEAGYKFDIKGDPVAWFISGSKAGEFKMALTGIRAFF